MPFVGEAFKMALARERRDGPSDAIVANVPTASDLS
jgi:hypothetical protein